MDVINAYRVPQSIGNFQRFFSARKVSALSSLHQHRLEHSKKINNDHDSRHRRSRSLYEFYATFFINMPSTDAIPGIAILTVSRCAMLISQCIRGLVHNIG